MSIQVNPNPTPLDEWYVNADGFAQRDHINTPDDVAAFNRNNPKYIGDLVAGEKVSWISKDKATVNEDGSWVVTSDVTTFAALAKLQQESNK